MLRTRYGLVACRSIISSNVVVSIQGGRLAHLLIGESPGVGKLSEYSRVVVARVNRSC